MLHRRYRVRSMQVDGRTIPLRRGDLVVAARAESGHLDWEAIVHTVDPAHVAAATHRLRFDCDDDAPHDPDDTALLTLRGVAFLVRAVDRALVFRGDGPLDGVDLASFHG